MMCDCKGYVCPKCKSETIVKLGRDIQTENGDVNKPYFCAGCGELV